MPALFPLLPPYDCGLLPVGGGHRIHYAQYGRADGLPALVLHGGPGSGSSDAMARFFDPERYRVVVFDQRGSGRSQPPAETRDNDTGRLLADIETLRRHLGIARWLVMGGSWGAALAAAYASRQRPAVTGVLLRALFLTGSGDLDWFFREARDILPAAWEQFAAVAPAAAREDLLPWLASVFAGDDREEEARVAAAWSAWERALSGHPEAPAPTGEALAALVRRYRVQCHYLIHRCWLGEDAVLAACAGLAGLPVLFLHGDADRVCRPESSRRGAACLPESRLQLVAGVGHDPYAPAMVDATVRALDGFAASGRFL